MNTRRVKSLFLSLFSVLVILWASNSFSDYKPKTVLFLSFDALDIRSVNQLKGQGQLPGLSELNLVPMVGGPVTTTMPGHSEVLTGLSYAVTGIKTNDDFDSKIAPEWTIFGIIRRSFPDAFISAIFSKYRNTGDLMVGSRHQPYYYLAQWAKSGGMNAYFNASEIGRELTTEETRAAANRQIDQFFEWQKNTHTWQYFIYVHFAEPDHTGHQTGMGSAEWNASVVQLDAILSELRDRLRPEVVLVYSDHGFNAFGSKDHGWAPKAFLAATVTLQPHGMRWDVLPTICDILGLPWKTYQPALLGRSLWIK